jgi:peptide/nickel transport system permease protein
LRSRRGAAAIVVGPPLSTRAVTRPRSRSIARHARGIIGAAIVLTVVAIALLADQLSTHDPLAATISARLQPPGSITDAGDVYLLGTDPLGRDLLSRVLHGARISLVVGVVSVGLSGIVGVTLGLIAGYYGGMFDLAIMRLVDLQMAFPFIVLTIAVVAVMGSSLVNVIVVLALASWVVYARLVRGLTLALRAKEYVEGARAVGCLDRRIIARHIFPNALPAVLIVATYQFAHMVIAESALSFLGLGLPPPTASWGASINDGRAYLDQAWWITTIPGLALMFTVLGATLLGDWARETLDPTLRVS